MQLKDNPKRQGDNDGAEESQTSIADTEETGDLRDEKTRLRLLIRLAYYCTQFYPTTNMTFAQKMVGMKDEEEAETENKATRTKTTQILSELIKIR